MNVKTSTSRGLCLAFLTSFCMAGIKAEGIKQLVPQDTNIVMLHTNSNAFGNFAAFGSNDTTGLFVRLLADDTLYVGLSPQAAPDGSEWAGIGDYAFQIVDGSGTVVFGPFQIDENNTNADTWDLANAGPDVLDPVDGYDTDTGTYPYAMFVPGSTGDYRLEFTDGDGTPPEPGDVVNIKFYDFTVVNGGVEFPGRLWSRQWALRTPPIQIVLPECGFDRQFNGTLYSYTTDGFVSRIDFDSSGFQGLSFTIAFGDTGPGNTGDLILDRMSVNNANATAGAAVHQVFVSEPDINEFPTPMDPCGQADLLSVECIADSFCINVGVTRPGQVDLLLDFTGNNGVFDPETEDVLIAMQFTEVDTTCIGWNGLKGDGTPVMPGDTIVTFLRYSQGVQHYAKYDVELLKHGFCVETIRPANCPGLATNLLYWDDSNIADNVNTVTIDESEPHPGVGDIYQVELDGCECQVDSCRTWTNFQLGDINNSCIGQTPHGYGEENTLNTWWYGRTTIQGPIILPVITAEIVGDTSICNGDSTELTALFMPDTLEVTFMWSGPGGYMSDQQTATGITMAGVYYVTVTDTLANCSAIDSAIVIQGAPIMTTLVATCQGPNMQLADIDLTVSGGVGGFTYLWSTDAMTEDLIGVLPGQYFVTVTDQAGCTAVDSITVEACCELMITCPPEDGGLFACIDDVPAPDTTLITVIDFCEPLQISAIDNDNGAEGCIGDTLVITRTYTITDGAGGSDVCVQTFMVVDSIPPMMVNCPSDTTVDCTSPTGIGALGVPMFTDACDGVLFSFSDDSTGFDGCVNMILGTITRTFFAEDSCGNVDSSCVQVITVQDTTPPTITFCPPDITVDCDEDPEFQQAEAMDNCSAEVLITFEDDMAGGGCAEELPIVRTWFAEDECGNVATCVQLITIQDTMAPVLLTCPPDTAFECAAEFDTLGLPTYMDNCSEVIITFIDDSIGFTPPGNLGTIIRTFYGTDICGNVDSSCVQTISIEDNEPPTILCPEDITLECPGPADPVNTGMPVVSDNCVDTMDLIVTFEDDTTGLDGPCFEGLIVRTFTVADIEGNTVSCSQNITIEDTQSPTFDAPADVTVECDVDISDLANTGDVSNVLDCSAIADTSFSDVQTAQGCDGTGTVVRTFIVTDACGNSASQTQTITIVDTTPPTVTPPADITVSCEEGTSTDVTGADVMAEDNCSQEFLFDFTDDDSGLGCSGTGVLIRSWTAEDECGNVGSAEQMITIVDDTPPTAICMDITIDFAEGDVQIITPEMVDGGSFDNCGDVTLELSDDTFECLSFVNMTQTVQLIVTDECGNTATCDVLVTGIGGSGLTIECPANIAHSLPAGLCEKVVNYTVNVESLCGDAADNAVLEQVDDSGLTSGDFFPIGETEQCYIAYVPGSEDTVSCCFTITILEHPENIFIACNDSVNISVDQNCEVFVNPDMVLEGDVYGCYDDFIVTIEGYPSGQGGVGIAIPELDEWLRVTVTNEAGNSCWGNLIFEDKLPPTIECIDVTVECGDDIEPVFIDPVIGTAIAQEAPASAIGPDGGAVTTQDLTIVVPANAMVTDVNITIDLEHTWSADLDVFLIGPDGTSIELASDVCGAADDWDNVTFDDEAAITVAAACAAGPALSGSVQPAGDLSDFDGLGAGGTWTLEITDDAFGDGGTLISVNLEVAYFVALPYAPTAEDACGEVDLTYEETQEGDDCENIIVTRTWTATDGSGNTASCVQTITIVPLTLDGLEFPPLYEASCGDSDHPDVTGWPTLDGEELVGGIKCNIFTSWWDHIIPGCGGGTKIQREWTVLDWCTLELITGTQLLKFTDDEPPVFETCPPDVTVNTLPWFCYADVNLQEPEVSDACGTPFTLTPSASSGQLIQFGSFWRLDSLGIGTHTITWTAEDECGNSSTCSYDITVEDHVPPVPLCDEHTVVALTEDLELENGLTKVPAEVFDDGSYDNCTPVSFLARRIPSCIDFDWTTEGAGVDEIPNGIVDARDRGQVFRTKVPFACCDVGQGPVMVELRVTDENGNSNTCMVEVTVQDKIAPYIECPPNVVVSCEFWFDAHETNGFVPQDHDPLTPVFGRVLDDAQYDQDDREPIIIDDPGRPTNPSHPYYLPQPHQWGFDGWADDNCEVEITVRVRIFNDCSGDDFPAAPPSEHATRLVERTFRARDAQGNSSTCVQRIWVVDFTPFYISDQTCNNPDPNDGVIWPCDKEYLTCPEEIPVDYPTIFEDQCNLIGVTYEDEVFEFVDGSCKKILRTWTVIDWCQYNVNTGEGYWQHVQIIKILDNQPAAFNDCPTGPVTLCVADDNVYLPANNQVFVGEGAPNASSCSAHVEIEHTVHETCSDYVIYDVKLYLNNGPNFIQVVSKTEASVDTNNDATLKFYSASSSNLGIRQNGVPYNDKYCIHGQKDYHRILWTVEDGCGNISTCEYLLRVEDCKQPSPVCVGLSSVVMPSSGSVTIWAVDFNASSFDDCTAAEDLLYSFSGDTYQPGMEFDCESIDENGSPSFVVEIWVADEGNDQDCNGIITWDERNKDYCTTFIVIDDNEGVCPSVGSIGGEIRTMDHSTVEDVQVDLMDPSGLVMHTVTTAGNGIYQFLNPLANYKVEPLRDDNHRNGVSTLDLVRIQQHLLGMAPFESPYLHIAADANNSQSVSAIDLVEIRKLILGLYLEFPANNSWRFVDADYVFIDNNNPWPFHEYVLVSGGFETGDFVGVKIGDVNGTVVANAQKPDNGLTTRNAPRTLILNTDEQVVNAGEEVSVAVTAEQFDAFLGFQFTLETKGLVLKDIESGVLQVTAGNAGVHQEAVTISWSEAKPVSASAEAPLMRLVFEAQSAGTLSEMLSLGSRITTAEAYDNGRDILGVSLVIQGGQDKAGEGEEYALFQNEPNPFENETEIGFTLPVAMDATLTIFDVSGKVVLSHQDAFAAGYNSVRFAKRDLGNHGMLYYRLDAGDFMAVKKMVLIE